MHLHVRVLSRTYSSNKKQTARYDILTVELLRIQVFQGVTHHWASSLPGF